MSRPGTHHRPPQSSTGHSGTKYPLAGMLLCILLCLGTGFAGLGLLSFGAALECDVAFGLAVEQPPAHHPKAILDRDDD